MTARVLIVIGLLIIAFDCADFTVTGVSVLGAVHIGAGAYLAGVFTREFWIEDEPVYSTVDEVLDAIGRERGTR